jgi:Family of unknown function (DUF5723)
MQKAVVIFLLCISGAVDLMAQQNLGIQNSNYAGVQGSLLNPSSISDSKLKWDVNIISGGMFFNNNFLYASKKDVHFLGFGQLISSALNLNGLYQPRYDPANPNKLYNVTFATEILGPSFFIKLKNKQEIGFTMALRANANIKDISGNVAVNAFDFLRGFPNTDFSDNSARVNAMGWLEYGVHYSKVLYDNGKDEFKAGISVKYLQGIFAGYEKNTHINYNLQGLTNISFANTSFDYGRTNYDDFSGDHPHHLTHGHGLGTDIGFTWVHKGDMPGDGNIGYRYKLGISILDIGSIRYNNNTASYHLEAGAANFNNWFQQKYTSNLQIDRALSAVFYNGDSTKSQTGNHFTMALPTALSIQGDYNFGHHFFANATIIKGFGHGNNIGTTRADVYSVTPRYETRLWEFSLPLSVISYGQTRARLGAAVRYKYFFIGGDAPGSVLKINDLNGVDLYAGVHIFMPDK